jgi:hypothetical protein
MSNSPTANTTTEPDRSKSTPPSESDSLISTSSNRQKGVKTYVVCVPNGTKIPKQLLKYGSIKEIQMDATALDIVNHIELIENSTVEIINNVSNLSVSCSRCFSGNKVT